MFRKLLFFYIFLLSQMAQSYTIISMTIPKCGTGLINKVIKRMAHITNGPIMAPLFSEDYFTDANFLKYEFHSGHIWPTEKIIKFFSQPNKFRGFLLIRDPRDQVLSAIDYIKKGGLWGWFNSNLSHFELFTQLVTNAPQEVVREAFFFYTASVTANLKERYQAFINSYGQLPNFCLIRFEDLVGKEGGGSDERQFETIKRIAHHLDIPISDNECFELMNAIYGNSQTFNKGQIGRWKTEYTPEMKEFFKQHFRTEYLIELGYETTLDW